MARKAAGGRIGVEAALAFVAGAAWFALCAVLMGRLLPHSPVVVVGVVALDVVVVVAIAHFWGVGGAVTVGIAGVVALDWYYIPPTHPPTFPDPSNTVALVAYLVTGVLLGELAVIARRRAEVSEGERAVLADEQAALRRVATLVARETSPTEVFSAVTEEVGRLLVIDVAALLRHETDGTATVVAAWSRAGRHLPLGSAIRLESDHVAAAVGPGQPARIDSVDGAQGVLPKLVRELGLRSGAASPVVVDGRLWGAMIGGSVSAPIPRGTESRLGEFTELAGTAVANAQTRAELTASRARVVASADHARRHIERDLHDGVQQRLVSLGLGLRVAEDMANGGSTELRTRLADVREGLSGALDDLREISHGIHPAILSEGGLRPALGNVARRSPVPVELDVHGLARLPEQVEVGAYYIVSEALANVVKHARATQVHVRVEMDDAQLRLDITDDGIGGADPSDGSGLVGLSDRAHALGGSIEIQSPPGRGTSLAVVLPLADASLWGRHER